MATLQELIKSEIADFFAGFGSPGEPETPEDMQSQLLARITPLFSSMEQEPVFFIEVEGDDWIQAGRIPGSTFDFNNLPDGINKLYAAPQLPQPAVVDADDNFYSWFGREWHENYQHNQYTSAAKQMLGVMAESAWKAGRSAAMLQGAEPVQENTLRDGWVAVPVEPTEEMVKKMRYHCGSYDKNIKDGYKAMIAAAPQQEVK